MEKKNKNCNIPTAKLAEYRLAEAFGELPTDSASKKGPEEQTQEKMKFFLGLSKKPITPMAFQAVRELVEANG